ncbi:hypothetical protein I5U18_03300 [Serratia ureilytica]|uniref:transcriptional antitermination N peptide n=1 Tax=Serratia ureilytica TaxID=300181 RepID=UPI0018D3268D|nr:hypothetical protein [Serratia ureilytica]MBH1909596.1 hypothetical protein [Serratia ureilytica]HAT4516350.1 hypothetical protein [Serratia marcescens]
MTTIIVKPAKENSKTRRYRQRGEVMAKRREDADTAKKLSKAWAKLTRIELPAQKPVYNGSCCLPEVAMFAAGHRKSNKITAR